MAPVPDPSRIPPSVSVAAPVPPDATPKGMVPRSFIAVYQLVASIATYKRDAPAAIWLASTAFADPPSMASEVFGQTFSVWAESSFRTRILRPAVAVGSLTPSPLVPTVVTRLMGSVRAVAPPCVCVVPAVMLFVTPW